MPPSIHPSPMARPSKKLRHGSRGGGGGGGGASSPAGDTEFRREEEDKASLVTEETEARAARSARERAAEGDCTICFSEKPNIATLCCGKAVHLNCIAEWLGSNTSCPQCRATIPRLQTTTAPAPSNQADTESVDGSTFSDSTAVDHDHDERRTRQPKAAGIQIQSN